MERNYKTFYIVITYTFLLRLVLWYTTGLSIFNLGLLFDIIFLSFWIGVFLLFIKNHKLQKIYYVSIVVAFSLVTATDSMYYKYFKTFFSKTSLSGARFLLNGNFINYNLHIPIEAFLVTPLIAGVIYMIIKTEKKDVILVKDFYKVAILFGMQFILFVSYGTYSYETNIEYYQSDAYLFESIFDRKLFSEKYGYYNFHIIDIIRFKEKIDTEESFLLVDEYFETKDTHTDNDMTNSYEGYNLITILGETLDTRFIDETLTPNLYMMLNNGYSFENYYTPVFQIGATSNSEFMSFTALNAISSSDWSNNIFDGFPDNVFPYSLANQLQENDYDTYYFHSGFEDFYNRQTVIPDLGFDTVKFQEDLVRDGLIEEDKDTELWDTEMMLFLDEYVDYSSTFYIDLLTYSMHGAYNQDELYDHDDSVALAYPDTNLPEEIECYMEKLVEFDLMLGMLIDKLAEEGVLDNTLFAIYPDHYPYIMDGEVYSEYIGVEIDSHEINRQELILYATDMTKEVISQPGSTKDIAPTLLNLLMPDANYDYFMGIDLFSDKTNYIVFEDLTITNGTEYLTIDGELIGNYSPIVYQTLMVALESEITVLEIQKDLLNINYFEMLKNR